MKYYLLLILIIVLSLIFIFIVTQILIVLYNGSPGVVPNISRDVQVVGSGRPLTYVVMGDSTAISQGSGYKDGFAVASTNHLADTYEVRVANTGVSGATAQTVRNDQLNIAASLRPDIVLLAVGANDATHFTRGEQIRDAIRDIIDELKKSNSNVQIIITGSPAMDSVSRFPAGTKQLMALRTQQVNAVFEQLARKSDLILAPIAKETRDAFIADPTLTASDNFHPNARGYALWIPIINRAIDKAVARKSNI